MSNATARRDPVLSSRKGGAGARAPERGFTLIELVIVVGIIAVLALIALPSYQRHMQKARRANGEADLMQLSQLLERHYTVNRSYAGFTIPLPLMQSPSDTGATVAYTISLEDLAASTYTLKATPTGPQSDDPCGVLSVKQTGAKTAAGSNPSGACW